MDSSLLDVSADIIGETPNKKPMSPRSFAKDVVERLAIVTPSGRVDAAESLSSNPFDVKGRKFLVACKVCAAFSWLLPHPYKL